MTFNDLMDLIHMPRMNLAAAIGLAHELCVTKPETATEAMERCVTEMKAQAALASRKWGAREKAVNERDASRARAADQGVDTSVRALHGRIWSAGLLSPGRHPEAALARQLETSLFGDGLSWLNTRFDDEWAHVDKLLKRIDDEKLAATIDTVAGPAYLAELRQSFESYGQTLGKTQPRPDTESITVAEDLQKLSRCMSAYAVQVVATADESKPETVEAARRALQPLIDYRAAMSRSRAADKKSPAEPEPAPVAPE